MLYVLRLWIQDASSKSSDEVGLHLTLNPQPKATLLPIQFGILLCCHNFFAGLLLIYLLLLWSSGSTFESDNSTEQGGLDCESVNSTTWSRFVDFKMTVGRSVMELVLSRSFDGLELESGFCKTSRVISISSGGQDVISISRGG